MKNDGERITELLQHLKKSKNALGISIGDKNGMRLQHVEKGRNSISEKLAKDINKTYPEISYRWLLTGEGSMLQERKDPAEIKVSQPLEYFRTKAGTFYEELPNGRYKIHVPKVPFKAYSSFIETFQDEYEEEKLREAFEEVTFTVDQVGHGKYIAFTTANDSMNGGAIYDTPSGAEVLARKLGKHHWQDGFRPTDYGWIIVSHNGIFHKDIENTDTPGKVVCKSRNPSPEFSDFTLILDEVHSIWKVIKRTF